MVDHEQGAALHQGDDRRQVIDHEVPAVSVLCYASGLSIDGLDLAHETEYPGIMAKQKTVVSLALDFETKKKLDRMKHPSLYMRLAITRALGKCPCCGGNWKRKPAITAGGRADVS